MKPELAVEIGKLATNTRIFPLYEVIDGRYVLNRRVDNPKPIEDYLKLQGRFRHLKPEDIGPITERVNQEYEKIVTLSETFPVPSIPAAASA
jgi:pyruvate ferredoxin oxidoreductase beta subunit